MTVDLVFGTHHIHAAQSQVPPVLPTQPWTMPMPGQRNTLGGEPGPIAHQPRYSRCSCR
jgi:hypothetical protein